MPTYRYRCSGCGEEFELWQSINDESLRTHEDGCGGEVLKVLTPAGIVLKGSGFYRNDSRSSDGKRKGSDGSKPKPDTNESTDSKERTDSKESKDSTDRGGSSDSPPSSSESGTNSTGGDSTSSTTSPGDSKSAAGAAKPS
jgi:putative FmdB family regulatory protein